MTKDPEKSGVLFIRSGKLMVGSAYFWSCSFHHRLPENLQYIEFQIEVPFEPAGRNIVLYLEG